MTIAGKADDFTAEELVAFSNKYDVTKPKEIIQRTVEAFSNWTTFAAQWIVAPNQIEARALLAC